MESSKIVSGQVYWIDFDGQRVKAVALRPTSMPHWWFFFSDILSDKFILPCSDVKELIADDQPARSTKRALSRLRR